MSEPTETATAETTGETPAPSDTPFDPTEVDRKLAAEHTLGGLAETANHVVFDPTIRAPVSCDHVAVSNE